MLHRKEMEPYRDYLSKKELGIRIKGDKTCRVIRVFQGEWIEFGPEYTLPVDPELLHWSPPGIPPSTLAVALKIYELDNLWTDLRNVLSARKNQSNLRVRAIRGAFPENRVMRRRPFVRRRNSLVRPV